MMRLKRRVGAVSTVPAVIVVLFALASCTTPAVVFDVPEGFARYVEDGRQAAISPEGVLVSAYRTENKPEQSISFWTEAVELQLTQAGYLLLAEGEFATPDGDGHFFEWMAPLGEEDWVYLTAFCVDGGSIGVVEAAGPYDIYNRYRERIRESLRTVTIR